MFEELITATEEDLSRMEVPYLEDVGELVEYIESLTNREHDYGSCVYAMSLAAVATFNHVASKLGVTGFQASCADLDILRHTRDFKWGKLIDYGNLMWPQYLSEEHFPSYKTLLENNKDELQKRAKRKLVDQDPDLPYHPNVLKHLLWLAKGQPK